MGIYSPKQNHLQLVVCENLSILKLKKAVGHNKRTLLCEISFIDELKDGEFSQFRVLIRPAPGGIPVGWAIN